jgi:predicted membrane-bound mannosyltransferase
MKKYNNIILLGILIIILGILLRLLNLNSLPVFADEAIYVRWSQVMQAEPGLRFLPLSDGKQPLYMWLTIPFLKLVTDPLLAGRVLTALSGGY